MVFFSSFQLVFIVHYQWSMINRTVNAKCTYEITSSDRIFSFILCTVCLHCIHKRLKNGEEKKIRNKMNSQCKTNWMSHNVEKITRLILRMHCKLAQSYVFIQKLIYWYNYWTLEFYGRSFCSWNFIKFRLIACVCLCVLESACVSLCVLQSACVCLCMPNSP